MEETRTKFIKECYEDAVNLKKHFRITEAKEWDINTVVLELGVQIGHVFDIKCNNKELKEEGRDINNLGDEISDVLLQTIYLGYLENVDFNKKLEFDCSKIEGIMVLYGQLAETIMEETSYRFKKERKGFNSRKKFIQDRILRIYILTLNYAKEKNIDVIKEFKKMKEDAEGFLSRYEEKHRM